MVLATMGTGTVLLLLVTTDSFLSCYSYKTHDVLMELFMYCLPFISNFLMELQYCQFLNTLRFRYKELNKCLLKNSDLMPTKIGEQTNKYFLCYTQCFILDFELVSTVTKVSPRSAEQDKTDSIHTINQVTKIHMILTETACLANKAFCFQQLLKIAISFVSIIAALFLFAMVFAVKDPSRLNVDVLFFLWTFSNAVEMFVIVRISAETGKEVSLIV